MSKKYPQIQNCAFMFALLLQVDQKYLMIIKQIKMYLVKDV